jgi:SAM-dependent methyltransferase
VDTRAVKQAYDQVAAAYARQFVGELAGKPLDRALLTAFAELTRGGRVLEVGGGPGQVGHFLHDLGADVLSTDLSPEMIAQARALHPALPTRVEDMLAVDEADGAFRGLVAAYAIVHLGGEQIVLAAREWARLVASGGWLLLSFHVEEETASVHLDEFLGQPVAMDFRFHPVEAVESALVAAGFAVDSRLLRRGHAEVEHPSLRAYLLARRG